MERVSVSGRIGLEIKLLRERLKLSAKDLAERVGLSPSQISRLESGQRRVDAVVLSKIARALEVSPSYFFEGIQPGDEAAEPPEVTDSGDETGDPADSGVRPLALAEPAPMHLGKLIREERRRRHVTAEELAQRIGKARSFLQDLEAGRAELVTGEVLVRIARALKLEPELLLEAQRAEIRDLRRSLQRVERAHTDRTLGELQLGQPEGARRGLPLVEAEEGGLLRRFDGHRPEGRLVDYVYVPGLRVSDGFAVVWRGDEMSRALEPSFKTGDMLVFAADRPARHEDLVLAVLRAGGCTFRQLFLDAKGLRLQPLNLAYSPLILDREDVQELFVLVARLATL